MVRQEAEIPNKNPLKTLHDEGQTVWLDFLSRTFLADDGLKRLIERDGLTGVTLFHDPELSEFEGRVSDSGEGRWTLKAAIDEGVPASVLSSALYGRFTSRGAADFADKLLSAMRHEFGGHTELSPNKKVAAHR
jgi:hypothetical protein